MSELRVGPPNPAVDDITITSELSERDLTARAPRNAFLLMIYGDALGQRTEIGATPLTIGRHLSCDIQLLDNAVSRIHYRVVPGEYGVLLQDEGSTNRTYVNDRPVQAQPLQDGDVLRVGRTIFKFLTGDNVEAAYHEEIYRLMTTDNLTGAANRRVFQTELERRFNEARRYGRPLSLLVLDLDRFKRVNDTFGHLFGDQVLRRLGALVTAEKRDGDTFCRYGGEEFALIMPETALPDALLVAERIRKAVEDTSFDFEGRTTPVTVSIGAAAREDSHQVPEDLVKRADVRLYDAKEGGRNRVEPRAGA
jgi:diguanylate cyclase (GGDEF)-like protein